MAMRCRESWSFDHKVRSGATQKVWRCIWTFLNQAWRLVAFPTCLGFYHQSHRSLRLWMWKETFLNFHEAKLDHGLLKSSTSIASNVLSLAYNNHMFTIPFHCLKSVPFSPKRPLRPGEIYSWGWGEFGQLGLGFSSSSFQAWLGMLGT